MAWEWVAPAATGLAAVSGVFFTWLTGRQGREQVERMTRRAEEATARDRLAQERREAYFTALRAAEVTLRRRRYQRKGEQAKLAEVEQSWPKGKRIEMDINAVIAVETFGTPQARRLLGQWREAVAEEDEQRMRAAYDRMIDLARRELGVHLLGTVDGSAAFTSEGIGLPRHVEHRGDHEPLPDPHH